MVEIAEILLDRNLPHSENVAEENPTAVSKNLAFVLDNRHFKDVKDILSDSLGSWICTGTKTSYCTATEKRITLTDSEHYGEKNSVYKIERRFYKNRGAEDVKRNFALIKNKHFISCRLNKKYVSGRESIALCLFSFACVQTQR